MRRSLTLTRHGFRRARRHLGAVLLVYLAALIPALLVISVVSADLAPVLDHSLFAERVLEGDSSPVWIDYLRSEDYDLEALFDVLPGRYLLVILLHVLVAAGVVEALLDRATVDERPLFSGMARHGFRFVRSAVVFVLVAGVALFLVSLLALPFEEGDGLQALYGWGLVLAVGLPVYGMLDLGYDFSRISAAAHNDGRMLVGFFKALGFGFKHLGTLAPLYVIFALPLVALHVGSVALRPAWGLESAGEILGWLLAYQAVLFATAFLRVGLWGAEVAYFQGLGEPRWCGRKMREKGTADTQSRASTEDSKTDERSQSDRDGDGGTSRPAATGALATGQAPPPQEAGGETEREVADAGDQPSEGVPGSLGEVPEPAGDVGLTEPALPTRPEPWGAKPGPERDGSGLEEEQKEAPEAKKDRVEGEEG